MRIIDLFKNLFFIGLILLFLSCFFEWYSFQMITSSGETVVKWSYHLFSGWTTPFSDSFNDNYRPTLTLFPLTINIILVGLIFFSTYIVFLNNVENITPEDNKMIYGYGIMALPILLIYYIWIFPWYLEDLYYPTMVTNDLGTGFISKYTIGLGNILAIFSFPLIFAYSLFYFLTVLKFERKDNSPDNVVHKLLQNTQEELDLDGLIAEEEVRKISNDKTRNRTLGRK